MLKAALGAAVVGFVCLGAVIGARTAALSAPGGEAASVALLPAPAVSVEAAARRLSLAIQIETISRTPGVVDDPAAFDALHALLEQSYPLVHAAMRREVIASHTLVYTLPGSDPGLDPMVLLAHQDVVPAEAGSQAAWSAPPFSGEIREGAVWGRGAMDNKGSLIALMEAMEALLGEGFTPRRSVIFVFGHDEEIGGSGAAAAAALMQARGQRAWFVLDEGMAVVEDFPLTGAPAALIGIAEKGYMTLRVRAEAEGGHSSMPPSDTALERLSRAILAIRAAPFPGGSGEGPARELLLAMAPSMDLPARAAIANPWAFGALLDAQLSASPGGAALARTTIAPTVIEGGSKENVLPRAASALINLRLHPRDAPEAALAHVRASVSGIEGVRVEVEGRANPASPVSETNSRAYALIAAAARAHAPPGAPVAPMLVLAATDSRHFAAVAENTYRFMPMWESQADLSRIHGVDERLSLANLDRMISFYAQVIATGAR